MRWESLFADLESQVEAQLAEELREEIAESTRVEKATQSLAARLAGYRGTSVRIRVAGARELHGTLGPVGADYVCLEDGARTWLIRRAAIEAIAVPAHRPSASESLAKSRWAAVVRALLRDRQQVQVHGLTGLSLGEGTVQQAAEDFLVVAIHPRDEFVRSRTVQGQLMIPYDSIGWLTSGLDE